MAILATVMTAEIVVGEVTQSSGTIMGFSMNSFRMMNTGAVSFTDNNKLVD
jgi:hypothetical protein